MGFTRSTTDISVHQKLGDYPNLDNGLTPDDLKKRYDERYHIYKSVCDIRINANAPKFVVVNKILSIKIAGGK